MAKKVDASDRFGEGADQEEEEAEARPEDADTFGAAEPLVPAGSLTGTDVEIEDGASAVDEAGAVDEASDLSGPLDDDRSATGSEADDADTAEEPSLLRDLADPDADDLEAEDLGGLDA